MKLDPRPILALTLLVAPPLALGGDGPNLVKNPEFRQPGARADAAEHYAIEGDASRSNVAATFETPTTGIALDSGRDLDGDGRREGWVRQDVPIDPAAGQPGRWYRFQIRGLPEDGFAVRGENLMMKADFFADRGKRPLDGVTRKINPLVEQERRDLTANGVRHKGGAATWKTYAFEFRLPFPDVDLLRLGVGFRDGQGSGQAARFLVAEVSLEAIPAPADAPGSPAIRPARPTAVDPSKLVALGGRWSYLPGPGETVARGGQGLTVTEKNADRLLYDDGQGRYTNPFAENMAAWLRRGYLDLSGKLVEEDALRADNVTITFDHDSMIVHARSLPNHPTSKFPSTRDSGDRNPNYIQEQDSTYYVPLKPRRNPAARAMKDRTNANRALPMGPIGFAVNGVVFFNPFDMGMTDATDLMDRCCGHPNQFNQYHYHKYPVCVKSPFADEGAEHSPVLGWAFDGYAIHGPYEGQGVMAKDSKDNPLNPFNGHEDATRGWHYHVTPGQFPYILGGYWGQPDPRNFRRGGPPGGGPGPILLAVDADRDREISAQEIQSAPAALRTLDRDNDGKLSRSEIQGPNGLPPGRPGDARFGGPGGRMPPPLVSVLDRDRDGELSSKEIADASEALKALDADNDGKISEEEFRPGPR